MTAPNDIKSAMARIAPHIRQTPVMRVEAGALCNTAVSLKLEHTQITGSFKLRGAFNSMLNADVGTAGVVATSGGNHGAAVAYAATKLGHSSTVFVPKSLAHPVKVARMREFGAEVVLVDEDFAGVTQRYIDFAEDTGALAIHPFDAPNTLAGQGTVALEMEQQLAGLDTLLVSVGGGGLIGGIAAWFGDRIRIIAVETEQTASYAAARVSGFGTQIVPAGISASALGGTSIGALGWQALSQANVTSVVVSDQDVIKAGEQLWSGARLVGEPGAATAMAALTSGGYAPEKDENVAVLICGGNADPNWFMA